MTLDRAINVEDMTADDVARAAEATVVAALAYLDEARRARARLDRVELAGALNGAATSVSDLLDAVLRLPSFQDGGPNNHHTALLTHAHDGLRSALQGLDHVNARDFRAARGFLEPRFGLVRAVRAVPAVRRALEKPDAETTTSSTTTS